MYIIREMLRLVLWQLFVIFFFFFNDPATTEIYTLSLHDALPISIAFMVIVFVKDKHPLKWHELALLALFGLATLGAIRMLVWWALLWPYVVIPMIALLRSEEHTSELQSQSNLVCRLLLEKKKKKT